MDRVEGPNLPRSLNIVPHMGLFDVDGKLKDIVIPDWYCPICSARGLIIR